MKAEEVIEKFLSLSRYIPKTYTEKINKCVALGEEMKQIWRLWDIKGNSLSCRGWEDWA